MCSAMDNFVQIHELLTAESQYARRQVALKGETVPKNSIYRVMSVPVLCTSISVGLYLNAYSLCLAS